MRQQISSLQSVQRFKEEEHKNEIKSLLNEIQQLKQSRELFRCGDNAELKSYIVQLETDNQISAGQNLQLAKEKADLEQELEVASNKINNIAQQVQAELELEYAAEISDLKCICESLQAQNTQLLSMKNMFAKTSAPTKAGAKSAPKSGEAKKRGSKNAEGMN